MANPLAVATAQVKCSDWSLIVVSPCYCLNVDEENAGRTNWFQGAAGLEKRKSEIHHAGHNQRGTDKDHDQNEGENDGDWLPRRALRACCTSR